MNRCNGCLSTAREVDDYPTYRKLPETLARAKCCRISKPHVEAVVDGVGHEDIASLEQRTIPGFVSSLTWYELEATESGSGLETGRVDQDQGDAPLPAAVFGIEPDYPQASSRCHPNTRNRLGNLLFEICREVHG